MEKKSLDYLALQFCDISNNKTKEGHWLNNLLDQLNALDYKSFSSPEYSKKMTLILSQCFSLIAPHDTFLVAKCCQLLLTHVGKQCVQLEKPLLDIAVPWCLQALQQSADIALLDILQALEAVICSSTDNLQAMVGDIMSILETELEGRVSMTTPIDVRVWRVQCLTALAPAVTGTHRSQFVHTLWQLLQHSPRPDCDGDVQVLKCVLEALETICQADTTWLTENLGDVLGVVVTFVHFGLHSWQYQIPSRLFPLPGTQWEPPPAPNIKSKTKRRQKKRVSNIGGGGDKDEDTEARPVQIATPSYMVAPTGLNWLTSDSEVSDSEGGRARRLRRTQARVRLAAINLLVYVAKTVNIRELFGYYSSLLGTQGLSYNLVNDPNPRLCGLAASTVAFLLGHAKSYLAQAQQSSVTSYTPFSSVLASLLEHLHQCIIRALKSTGSMSVLQCACCLVDVTPYHRLRPNLLPPLLFAALPFLRHKEVVVSVAALTLLGWMAAVEPQTDEVITLLSSSKPPVPLSDHFEVANCSWVLSASLQYLEEENQKTVYVPLRVEWWQVLSNLIRHHFRLVQPHVDLVLTAILRDAFGTSELVSLHAARTFQQLASVLGSTAENINKESDEAESVRVWTKVLQSQLLALVGTSSILASVVCDCLSAMSPNTYENLSENLQICCVTSLLCCARDEEPAVRAAAIQALAFYLTFPTLSQDEQFVCDCSDLICQLVKDSVPLVNSKAAWALGNLTDMLYKNQHGEEIIPPIQLITTSLEIAQGKVKLRANGVRALGNLLGLLKDRHLCKPEYKDIPLNATQVLVKNACSTSSMKVSWNACYALGSMLKNEAILETSSTWQGVVLPALCSLILRSSNFKVRSNACAALSSVPTRKYFGTHYLDVWRAVVEGLENALNMTDFSEVKHQDDLLEQLCLTLCHLATILELSDLSDLHEVIVYHLDSMQHHIVRFISRTVPERTEAVLKAASSVALLRERIHLSTSQRDAVTILSDVFTFSV